RTARRKRPNSSEEATLIELFRNVPTSSSFLKTPPKICVFPTSRQRIIETLLAKSSPPLEASGRCHNSSVNDRESRAVPKRAFSLDPLKAAAPAKYYPQS